MKVGRIVYNVKVVGESRAWSLRTFLATHIGPKSIIWKNRFSLAGLPDHHLL
jgi:hypothetical protein